MKCVKVDSLQRPILVSLTVEKRTKYSSIIFDVDYIVLRRLESILVTRTNAKVVKLKDVDHVTSQK